MLEIGKAILIISIIFLSGCAYCSRDNVRVWFLCYDDDVSVTSPTQIISDGLSDPKILKLKCNGGTKEIHFEKDFGDPVKPKILFDKEQLNKMHERTETSW